MLLRCRRFEPRLRVESWPQGTERPEAAAVGGLNVSEGGGCCRSGEQGWRLEAETAAASILLLLPFLESCHPLVVFGSLLGLLAALLLEVDVGDDRFGGSYRRSDLGYGLALLFAVVESGVEAGGERLCLGLAGLALVQPGLVVVVGAGLANVQNASVWGVGYGWCRRGRSWPGGGVVGLVKSYRP